jgi:isoquinoline 1-oxidoreductase beta subunit
LADITRARHEAPFIDIVLFANTEKPGDIGEPSTALAVPAMAAATGKRVRKLPLLPEAIRQA